MPKLEHPECNSCKRVIEYDDPHPCFKHSKTRCVKKLEGRRGWAPSECEPCITMLHNKLSAEGTVQENAEKNWDILAKGVTDFAQRVSTVKVPT